MKTRNTICKFLSTNSPNRLADASGSGGSINTITYDHQSRRIAKSAYNDALAVSDVYTDYIYDGWNLTLEITRNGPTTTVTEYFWGTDLSGSLHGAGGVGGLVAVSMNDQFYFPLYDNNGNIIHYADETGALVATYTYDAFGQTIAESGSMASHFRFRYSTKYHDPETDYYYYGYRFYSPHLGRWLTRDPLEEEGGLNLYAFVGNNALTQFDRYGLFWTETILGGLAADGLAMWLGKLFFSDWIDDKIINRYGGPEKFMDLTSKRLALKGPLAHDMFGKARSKNTNPINSSSTGFEKELHDRLQDALLNSELYNEKKNFIIERLKQGTHYDGHIHIDFQDAGESNLGHAIGGAQLYYLYTKSPPKVKFWLKDSYDFTRKGHMWGKLEKDGYLSVYEVDVFIEIVDCPEAAPEKSEVKNEKTFFVFFSFCKYVLLIRRPN